MLNPIEKELIKNLYLGGMTIECIYIEHFKDKCSMGAINYILRELGITRPNGKQSKINHSYFKDIGTEKKAYWLGFLYADGNVMHYKEKGNCYVLTLELKYEDKYMLELLKESLESDRKIDECYSEREIQKDSKYKKPKHNARIMFNSKQIFEDLNRYGVVPNKTFKIKELPQIDKSLLRHFIRGYFDGDGTVYKVTKNQNIKFGFYGTYDFITNMKNTLTQEIELNSVKVIKQKESNVSFITYSSKNNIIDFYNYIYRDSTIYLKRKRKIFEEYVINKQIQI